jgi:hypothetical protein
VFFFLTFKAHEKNISKLMLIFGFGLILVFFMFVEAIYRFITIPTVFYKCYGSKMG